MGDAMARKRRDELERAIEGALAPGAFIGYRDQGRFVEDAEAVKAEVAVLIEKGEAGRAVALLETFIAGCYEKSEEVDDSSGSFGRFVEELFCDWIRARRAAKADPAGTARMLLSWMESDDYGYCRGLETEAVKVLGRAALVAFEQAARERAAVAEKGSYARRRNVEILKAIHGARRDVEAYAALCEAEGELAPADCETLAEMCLRRRRPEDALAWVKRGLEEEKQGRWPDRPAWRLPNFEREILERLGRCADALAWAWEAYERAPSVTAYADLMKFVPEGERAEWHAKALASLAVAGLSSRIDLLVETKELERLAGTVEAASRADLAGLSHYTTEPAAKRLEKARRLLLVEGRTEEWEALAGEIRSCHRRKSGFMPGFERIAEGGSTRKPPFLERARRRWEKGAGRGAGKP
jgi:hypothetical protein